MMFSVSFRVGMYRDYSNIDGHVVSQVLISRNESDAMLVFEADTTRSAFINTVEIFDGCHNRISSIVRKDLDSHGYPCSNLGVFIEEKFKGDVFGDWSIRGLVLGTNSPRMVIGRSRVILNGWRGLIMAHTLHFLFPYLTFGLWLGRWLNGLYFRMCERAI